MNLITFSFEVPDEQQQEFIADIEKLIAFWNRQNVDVSLYRDISNKNRLTQHFQTEKSLEQIIALLQEEPSAKEIFERIREHDSRVGFSAMTKLI